MMRPIVPLLVWLVYACAGNATSSEQTSGGTEPETYAQAEPEAEGRQLAEPEDSRLPDAQPEPEPPDSDEDEASFESLVTRLEASPPADPLTLQAAIEACPPLRGADREARMDWFDGCQLRSALAHAADGSRWVGLGVDYSEGGPEGFVLWERDDQGERNVLRGSVDPDDVAGLLRRARRFRGLVGARNIVRAVATTYFSLNEYAPLVELGPPLEGWRLWIETTADLDHPEWVAWLISPGGERHEIERREAGFGACDGGGYWCEETDSECDEEGLRAEGRLCVLPIGIGVVAVAGNTLGFLGGVQVAGHGGYPPFHWVMTLPDDL